MKRKKLSVFISALVLTFMISMSGCYRISIRFENFNKKYTEISKDITEEEKTSKLKATETESTATPDPMETEVPMSAATSIPQTAEQVVSQKQYATYYVVNCMESITLRSQPDINSGEICQIPLNSAVNYVGTAANGFYEIYYMGQHGYALATYLQSAG